MSTLSRSTPMRTLASMGLFLVALAAYGCSSKPPAELVSWRMTRESFAQAGGGTLTPKAGMTSLVVRLRGESVVLFTAPAPGGSGPMLDSREFTVHPPTGEPIKGTLYRELPEKTFSTMGSSSHKREAQVEAEVVFAVPQDYESRNDLVVRHPKLGSFPLGSAKREK